MADMTGPPLPPDYHRGPKSAAGPNEGNVAAAARIVEAGGTTPGPDTQSGDYIAQAPYWCKVGDILDGADAVRAATTKYLPQYSTEDTKAYTDRVTTARFTNIFADIVETLAGKPFAEELKLAEDADQAYVDLAANIDGRGNSLHAFAGEWFFHGVAYGIDWVLVTSPKAQATTASGRMSQADQEKQGLRPYWLRIPAHRMVGTPRSAIIGGEEVIYHARYCEHATVTDGYAEETRERVREFNREPIYGPASNSTPIGFGPATYILWELQKDTAAQGIKKWVAIEQGPVGLDLIPLVPFITGRRKGATWQFIPPLKGCADLQIEHYQLETALKWIATLTAYPMLAGNGVAPETDAAGKAKPIKVGPRAVLYAPPSGGSTGRPGSWAWIEPGGTSLTFLKDYVAATEKALRELGRQPLTPETGNLTVITTAFAAQKANSACQAWALNLQTALERALKITALWLGVDQATAPSVTVFTDFAIDTDDQGPTILLQMRGSGDLSREQLWEEARRRNILCPDFDPKAEQQRLDAEAAKEQADTLKNTEANLKLQSQYAQPPQPGGMKPPAPQK